MITAWYYIHCDKTANKGYLVNLYQITNKV